LIANRTPVQKLEVSLAMKNAFIDSLEVSLAMKNAFIDFVGSKSGHETLL